MPRRLGDVVGFSDQPWSSCGKQRMRVLRGCRPQRTMQEFPPSLWGNQVLWSLSFFAPRFKIGLQGLVRLFGRSPTCRWSAILRSGHGLVAGRPVAWILLRTTLHVLICFHYCQPSALSEPSSNQSSLIIPWSRQIHPPLSSAP